MKATCETCRFWKEPQTKNQTMGGTCRRMPPNLNGGWPRTTSKDWCGFHEFGADPYKESTLKRPASMARGLPEARFKAIHGQE